MTGPGEGILTLEPLIEAIRDGVEHEGWTLSGLQKTTSHQFEGRWEGESTRSAYLFFHDPTDVASVDVYLDETSRGLTGNLALVVDLVALGELGDSAAVLETLAAVLDRELDARHRRPLTLRLRLPDAADLTPDAETEVRFKVRISKKTIAAGAASVVAFVREVMRGFSRVLAAPELMRLMEGEEIPGAETGSV